jgi:phosphatidylserine/phosphatidylglycerophosphate/cardiolipin synthase-like enzyme
LYNDDAVFKKVIDEEVTYRVSPPLWHIYKNHLHSTENKKELEDWINKWKELRKLDLTLDYDHFFLEGRHLDDFTKELISHAKSNVLVVNPFIEYCDLSNTLSDAKKKRISVQIITRQPQDYYPDKLKKKQEYLSQLVNEGVDLQYNNKVHAKLVVVDNAIAIVSSMNFYPDSSAGASWEAGLISLQAKTVESIVNSVKTKSM